MSSIRTMHVRTSNKQKQLSSRRIQRTILCDQGVSIYGSYTNPVEVCQVYGSIDLDVCRVGHYVQNFSKSNLSVHNEAIEKVDNKREIQRMSTKSCDPTNPSWRLHIILTNFSNKLSDVYTSAQLYFLLISIFHNGIQTKAKSRVLNTKQYTILTNTHGNRLFSCNILIHCLCNFQSRFENF